jgi:transposase
MDGTARELEDLRSAHADLLKHHNEMVGSHDDLAKHQETLAKRNGSLLATNDRLKREINALRLEYQAMRARFFGRRSEKVDAMQADGYAGYKELFRSRPVSHVACMAHIRRKIFEAQGEEPELAELLLAGIQMIYRVEAAAKADGITGEALVELRAGEPKRVLGVLKETMLKNLTVVLPKSGLGKALHYAINQWPSMERYLEVAEAELDNNSCEHTMRPIALGRENWLFAGSADGGRRAATLYSLVTSAKRMGINPEAYLADVITRVSNHKMARISELTPRHWSPAA